MIVTPGMTTTAGAQAGFQRAEVLVLAFVTAWGFGDWITRKEIRASVDASEHEVNAALRGLVDWYGLLHEDCGSYLPTDYARELMEAQPGPNLRAR